MDKGMFVDCSLSLVELIGLAFNDTLARGLDRRYTWRHIKRSVTENVRLVTMHVPLSDVCTL
jgi:hypothetical protein